MMLIQTDIQLTIEPLHEKTNKMLRRKQWRRSAMQQLYS